MITLADILDRAAVLLAADSAIAAWTSAQFGKAPVIFIGLNEGDPPGVAQCPCIILRPAHAADGQETEEFGYAFRVDWVISNAAQTTVGAITTYAGIRQLDDFGKLIYACLKGTPQNPGISANVAISDREVIYDDGTMFPMWLAGAYMTMRAPQVLGGEIEL